MVYNISNLLIMLMLTLPTIGQADIAVVVSKDSHIDSADREAVSALFLAKTNRLKGLSLIPVDLESGNETRNIFYQSISKKNPMQMKAYWSRLVFTGKNTPPLELQSGGDVINLIVDEPGYIGYIDLKDVNDSVKVLLTIR